MITWISIRKVYGAGERSALGTKKMITNRLHKLASASKKKWQKFIDDINKLVSHMYTSYRDNQKKLDKIREVK